LDKREKNLREMGVIWEANSVSPREKKGSEGKNCYEHFEHARRG